MRQISIPGYGWDTVSTVTGGIQIRHPDFVKENLRSINEFEFDDYPFTNIFWGPSPSVYQFHVIGFAGSYKQIEEYWSEWMWKFSQLLSCLDAIEAHVNLNCILGDFHWTLQPRLHFEDHTAYYQSSMKQQIWGITNWSEPDFSIDPEWISHCSQWGYKDWNVLERWVKSSPCS